MEAERCKIVNVAIEVRGLSAIPHVCLLRIVACGTDANAPALGQGSHSADEVAAWRQGDKAGSHVRRCMLAQPMGSSHMGTDQVAIVILGALAGGFVSGLAGFGTGITALGIWLYALEPTVAATLVVICSVVSQAQTLPSIWNKIETNRVLPFIVPGLLGVPLGTALLSQLDEHLLKMSVGFILILFSSYMLLARAPRQFTWGGRVADGGIGFAGGVLGGLAGLSGPLPTMWVTFRGWPKGESRGVFQAFNLSILLAALVAHIAAGFVTTKVSWAILTALPGTIVGAALGARAYTRLSDRRFRQFILVLLCFSGVTLIWTNARHFVALQRSSILLEVETYKNR
jgi:uncharacterized protein